MMRADWHDEGARADERAESTTQFEAMTRFLEAHGVDVTGAESSADLTMMKNAVDGFRRAAEALAGPLPPNGQVDDSSRHVVPPRAADETPRQYSERINRMIERFRALAEGPSRERPR
jgi:hypothetical protein